MRPQRKVVILISLLLILGTLSISQSWADDFVKVTQMDPSAFPDVTIYVSVQDESGQPVTGLTQDDFHLQEDGEAVEVKAFAGEGESRAVDIIFVFDVTGSMRHQIEGVKETSIAFANELRARNRDFRLGLVAFEDIIIDVRNSDNTLTADEEEFKGWIGDLRADGGGDDPEIALDALDRATEMRFRDNTQKVLILITDIYPHEQGDGTSYSRIVPEEQVEELRDEGFTIYAVAYDDPRYRALVDATNGEFYDIYSGSDFTGIIEEIGGLIATQYRITYTSARPSFDGTRRAVEVTVGETTATSTYLEQHLVNISSHPLIALIFLFPLLLALVAPVAWDRRRTASNRGEVDALQATPSPQDPYQGQAPPLSSASGESVMPERTAMVPPSQQSCPQCGHTVRENAKFCGRCGQPVMKEPSPPHVQAAPTTCPTCNRPLRPGAKFCGGCGTSL